MEKSQNPWDSRSKETNDSMGHTSLRLYILLVRKMYKSRLNPPSPDSNSRPNSSHSILSRAPTILYSTLIASVYMLQMDQRSSLVQTGGLTRHSDTKTRMPGRDTLLISRNTKTILFQKQPRNTTNASKRFPILYVRSSLKNSPSVKK